MTSMIRRFILVRMILARPRLAWSALFGLLVIAVLPHVAAMHDVTRYIVGWNAGAWLYLALAGWMMFGAGRKPIRHWARVEDEGQWLVLLLVCVAAAASLSAIVMELAVVKDMHGWPRAAHIALAVLTLLSSWAFTHVMFALHYARGFYAREAHGLPGGLEFPGTGSRITRTSCISPSSSAPRARPPTSASPTAASAAPAPCTACWLSSSTPPCWR